jgi:ribosome-binding ATPase
LVLADVATVDRRIEKVQGQAKAHPRDFAEQLNWLAGLRAHLNAGQPAAEYEPAHHDEWLTDFDLLSSKPRLYVVNGSEDCLAAGGAAVEKVQKRAAREGTPCLVLCAACEAELVTWAPADAAVYREEQGLHEPGLNRLITASYRLLGLITFFTITGGKEARAWTLRAGSTAYEAAGLIHSDIQRGFIRTEVAPVATILSAGGLSQARAAGHLRLEGREYVVQDGDVIHYRFNV